jgi:hypothetical protein
MHRTNFRAKGATHNRKLFQLYGKDDDASNVTYKTKNVYATDDRHIYFISDPPHLLKTTRNCFAKSFDHSISRPLWFTKDVMKVASFQNS